jgi:hypothetical protein
MTDYLADVVMPPPEIEESVEESANEVAEGEPPPHRDGPDEVSLDSDGSDEDLIPEPVRKQKIPQDEIFTPPKVKTILDPEEGAEDIPTKIGKPTKQTRKKRGPATPEQLERLARGRAKAAETRERKKKEKEEALAKQKSDKELVEAVREKERKKLRKKLEEPDEDVPPAVPLVTERVVEKPVVVPTGYSQEQLDEAVARAVEQSVSKVEILRKQRKAVKQKQQAKAKHEAEVFKDINSALKNDVWAQCFL